MRRLDSTSEPDRFVLKQPVAATPGVEWHYSNGGVEVLGAILAKVAHRPLGQFAKKALFDPLGITDWEWGRLANGQPAASWGLRLRPRDLAKIGQLVLNQGVWQGQRIVSAAWIKQMTAAQSPPGWLFGWGGDAYGYLWWLGRASVDNRDADWVGGNGWGGQRLFVVPSQGLVVAVTAGAYKHGGFQDVAGDTALDMVLRAATGH